MTGDLRERLGDLVADAPAYVVPDARTAWAAGARRRTRHRVRIGATVVVAAALLAGAVSWLPGTFEPAPAKLDGIGTSGYPAHVVDPWRTRDLPSAPGPMAMIYQRQEDAGQSWWTADGVGRTWQAPQHDVAGDYPPALSADGRMIAYLAGPTTYVVRDLVTGAETTFDSLTETGAHPPASGHYALATQSPSFWSPDGTRVLVRVARWDSGRVDALVLGVDGSVTEIRSGGFPVGWVDDDTLAFEFNGTAYDGEPPAELRLFGLDGQLDRKVRLQVPLEAATWVTPWSASVSPDGARLAIADETEPGSGDVYLLSTRDGSRLDRATTSAVEGCLPSWRDGEPVVFAAETLRTASGEELTSFDDRVNATCAIGAAEALAGQQHPGLGWWSATPRWLADHGWALGLVVVLVAVLVMLPPLLRRRRTRLGQPPATP